MNAEKEVKDDKVGSLNQTLTSVENELMGRALDRRDAELDYAVDCIKKGVEAGVMEIECGDGSSGTEGEGEETPPEEGGGEGEPGSEEGELNADE